MSPPNLLLTGATAFIGFHCLRAALEAHYSVRCAVRSKPKAESTPAIKKLLEDYDSITLEEVADLTIEENWLKLLDGIENVIHIASLTPRGLSKESNVVATAVQMTTALLNAATKAKTVKRVVIKSSIIAVCDASQWAKDDVVMSNSRIPMPTEPYANSKVEYTASKIAALAATDKFIAENDNLAFHVVNIMPAYTVGRNPLAPNAASLLDDSNAVILSALVGDKFYFDGPNAFPTVHVKDVANCFVRALGGGIESHRDVVVACPTTYYHMIGRVARHDFGSAFQERKLRAVELPSIHTLDVDPLDAVRFFGCDYHWQPFGLQVVEVVGQYLELLGVPRGHFGTQPAQVAIEPLGDKDSMTEYLMETMGWGPILCP